jgi:hypothetical protein
MKSKIKFTCEVCLKEKMTDKRQLALLKEKGRE